MASLYQLKPAFQGLLRPLVARLAAGGVTANQVTLAAAVLSMLAGLWLWSDPLSKAALLCLPVVLFVRMALNAVDGMLAREHGQASTLGMYLNELCDVVSDLALILPFAAVFPPPGVVAFALAACLAEIAGMLGVAAGAGRTYAGPFGKSDRAFALGAIAVALAAGLPFGPLGPLLFPLLATLSLVTVVNRIRAGLGRVP